MFLLGWKFDCMGYSLGSFALLLLPYGLVNVGCTYIAQIDFYCGPFDCSTMMYRTIPCYGMHSMEQNLRVKIQEIPSCKITYVV
jgi:hypothetical protein